jgi:hypothetical protein
LSITALTIAAAVAVCISFVSLVRSYHLGFRYFTFRPLSFVSYHCRNLAALSTTSFQFLLLSPPFRFRLSLCRRPSPL